MWSTAEMHRPLEQITSALLAGHPRALLEQAALALLELHRGSSDGFRILVRDFPVVEHILGWALARDPTTPRSRVGPAGDDADRLCSHSVTTPVELGLTASVPGSHLLNMGETAVTRDPVSKIKTTRWWRSRRRAGTSWREDHILIPPVSRVFARSEEAHSCSRD